MSVVSIREIAGTRGADSSGISEIKLTRIWRVETNNTTDDATTIFGSGLLPALFSPHPNLFFCIAQRASVSQEKAPFFWIVTVEYSSKPVPQERIDRESHPDPTDRPVRISMRSADYTRTPMLWIPCDPNGNNTGAGDMIPVANSANDAYDELPEVDDGRRKFHFIKNVATPPSWVFDFEDICVNSTPVTLLGRTCDARTLKLGGIELSELMQEQEFEFYQVSGDLHYNAKGWLYSLPDRGFNYLGTPGDNTTKKKILNKKDGSLPSVPQLLDGNGGVLSDPSPENAVLLYGKVYPEEDFSVLPPFNF